MRRNKKNLKFTSYQQTLFNKYEIDESYLQTQQQKRACLELLEKVDNNQVVNEKQLINRVVDAFKGTEMHKKIAACMTVAALMLALQSAPAMADAAASFTPTAQITSQLNRAAEQSRVVLDTDGDFASFTSRQPLEAINRSLHLFSKKMVKNVGAILLERSVMTDTDSDLPPALEQENRSLTVIDTIVDDWQLLKDSVAGGEVLLLNQDTDPLDAIIAKLEQLQEIDSLHIISHGSNGRLGFSDVSLSRDTLETDGDKWEKIGSFLSEDGDIYLFGCNVAKDEQGKAFVRTLADLTKADIAASINPTGHKSSGGDWELEYVMGPVNDISGFTQSISSDFKGVLSYTINFSQFRNFSWGEYDILPQSRSLGGGYTYKWTASPGSYVIVGQTYGGHYNVETYAGGDGRELANLGSAGASVTLTIEKAGSPVAFNLDGFTIGVADANSTHGGNQLNAVVQGEKGATDATLNVNLFAPESRVYVNRQYLAAELTAFNGVTEVRFTNLAVFSGLDDIIISFGSAANVAPVLSAIGNKTVNEGSQLTFTAAATDADGGTLSYSLVNAPAGASINASTGAFTWTPTEAQGPGSYTFAVRVSDGTDTDEETITVTVNEVNAAPVLGAIGNKTVNEESLLTFTAVATDADVPSNTLTYSLVGAPAGASIHSSTGVFTWTPTEAQGPGSYTFAVRVSDGTATDEETITVTVNEVNAAPVLNAIGNKSVNEESELTFTASATDAEGNPLTYSLVGAPAGASINAATGVFTWTPTETQGPDSYTFTVRVSDGTATDEEAITVTVNEVNTAPVLDTIGNQTVNEGSELTFTATATDADVPSNTLTYSLVDAPTGASINAATGVFTWTPTEAQGPGSYTFAVRVSDGTATDEETITITVNEVNTAPVLGTIGNKTVDEESELTFTATAVDADLPANTLTYSVVDAPDGASIDASTGVFTWTPTEEQGPGSYTFKVQVSDGALTDEETITVTVVEVNAAPVLNAIGNKSVNEGSELTFTASATDSEGNALTYSLVDAPTGASINAATGVFTWTPTEAQGPGTHTFTVRVSDGTDTDEETITVTVNEVNTAPVLNAIGNKSVNEGSELTFTASATDADVPSNTLTYSLVDAPTGASINAATGVFTWTPTEAQGPGNHTFTVRVSDGTDTDEKTITVTVNEVNTAPVLNAIGNQTVNEGSQLTFTATATDADLPSNTLTYSLVDAPAGASIDAATGEFTWTPTEAQGPGNHTFTVRVSDGTDTDEETITVTVNEVNSAPMLDTIGNQTADEGSELTFAATATDADLPTNTLTFSLVDAPTGASINAATGVFTWTPTEAQGPGSYTFTVRVSDGTATDEETITVTVNEVNTAPVLNAIGDQTVNEGSELTFTATATDADLPTNTLTFSLVDAPTGASINAATGVFTWTPTEAQGPGNHTFTVRVSDGTATDEETITVTVNEVNTAPVLNAIGNQTVDEGSELTFTATATDADLPANTLTYSLVDAPTGAAIDSATGVFRWTPAEAQGPGSHTFTVRVSDGTVTDEETITVTVNEVSTAPVLYAIGNQTVDEGSELTFTATATDADLPVNTLTYSLVDAPTGASIDGSTGVFTWTPTEAQGPDSYMFTVRVSDGSLTDEETITVTVNEVNTAPVLGTIGDQSVDEGSELTFTATATDADLPANTLTYSLVDAPEGAVISPETGVFTWTPTEAQGPESYTFTVRVSDGTLTDEETITVTVGEVNTAPVLTEIGNHRVDEERRFTFTATATDADLPANTLTYRLVDAPAGATIDSETGVFTWTPTEAQGPGSYTFTVQVSDGTLTDEEEITITVNEVIDANVSVSIGVDVLVNGKVENAGTATTIQIDGQQVTTVLVNEEKLQRRLKEEGIRAVITIPVTTGSDVVVGELNGRMVKNMENQQAIVAIRTEKATYTLPAYQIRIDEISSRLGANLSLQDIKVKIEIAEPLAEMVRIVQDAANREGLTLIVPPLSFKVIAEYGDRKVELSRFNAYIERIVALPKGVDPNRITTGVVVEPNGAVRHVPTKIVEIDGIYYAHINSVTNSAYSVVWHPYEFEDVEGHWAKEAVNNMGSRLIVNGTGPVTYSPDRDITRAEFAAIIVRGLGLRLEDGNSVFTDVKSTDWYGSAIQTAYEYGLIDGFEDGTFRPNDKITREQAMLIVSKAMGMTELPGMSADQTVDSVLGAFSDANSVSSWALNGVADSVSAGVISGRSSERLAPRAYITRAEVATLLERLLQKSDLINE